MKKKHIGRVVEELANHVKHKYPVPPWFNDAKASRLLIPCQFARIAYFNVTRKRDRANGAAGMRLVPQSF
jgi:hypothetical protein